MFPNRYFPSKYFPPRYFPKVGSDVIVVTVDQFGGCVVISGPFSGVATACSLHGGTAQNYSALGSWHT